MQISSISHNVHMESLIGWKSLKESSGRLWIASQLLTMTSQAVCFSTRILVSYPQFLYYCELNLRAKEHIIVLVIYIKIFQLCSLFLSSDIFCLSYWIRVVWDLLTGA